MVIKIIITTIDSKKTANDIAKYLIKDKLSPCVQITSNINSVYKWENQLEKSNEILLHIKTIPKYIEDCKKLILKYHNYDVPEILVINAEILNDEYKQWFIDNS